MGESLCGCSYDHPLLFLKEPRLSERWVENDSSLFRAKSASALAGWKALGSAVREDHMRGRGRVMGEWAVMLGGIAGGYNHVKNYFSKSPGLLQKTSNLAIKELNREYLYSGKPSVLEKPAEVGRKRFKPDSQAEGAHNVFRRDPITGKVTHYETYKPQTNPFNPSPWESMKRFDGYKSDKHWNKILEMDIYAPHIHDPLYPGGIRPALSWEIPK